MADSYIQLTAATRPDSPIAKAIEKRGEGLHHIGYRVDDCAAALEAMKAAGATPIDQAPRPGSRGTTVAFVHPEGQLRHADRAGPGMSGRQLVRRGREGAGVTAGGSGSTLGSAPLDPSAGDVAPAAVLWDMDGTVVDTEPYWMACEHELVDAFGGTWTEADARSIVGFDLLEAAEVLRARGGVDLPPEEIVERLMGGVIDRVRERVPWRPGARRLLADLQAAGVPCAMVTMSWEALARIVVDALGPARSRPSSPATWSATGSRTRSRTSSPPTGSASTPVSAWRSRTRRPACARPAPPGASCWPSRTSCRSRPTCPTTSWRRSRAWPPSTSAN